MSMPAIPGYTIKRTLGKGGMATVYLALHDKFERDVALKVMAPALSADAGFRERFLREAKIVAKISHPNIVAVYDVNEVDGVHYIAMEFHPGGDLKARLRDGLSLRESLQITKDVARALDFAHGKGYLHRDIKPDNILFRADGSAVLTDFGIAKATEGDANLTQMGMVAGTPKYMSPEQARGQALDADSDLYSLGIVLFEMLTGRLPYEATDPIALGIMHMNAPVPRLEGRIAHFQPLLDRLLAKQAGQRPQSGARLIQEIEALEKDFDFNATGESPARSDTVLRPSARRPVPAAAVPAAVQSAAADGDATTLNPSLPASPGVAAVVQEKSVVGSSSGATAARTPAAGSPAGKIAAALALVAALGGGGFWMKQGSDAKALSAQVTAEITSADAAMVRNALLAPADDNALAHYRRALALQPGNASASAGLQKLVAALQTQAYAAVTANRLAEAEALLAQAISIAPDNPGNPALESAIAEARSAAQPAQPLLAGAGRRAEVRAAVQERFAVAGPDALQRLRIAGLLGGARRALEDGDSATAIQRYQQVLQLEPTNRDARDGLRQARAR